MNRFILSTDSCCDGFKSDLAKRDVKYISLAYIHNGEEFRDRYDSEREYREFYEFIRQGNLPSTTQLNVIELEEYFEKLLAENEGDLVHITLSSGLSGTHDNAVAAARVAEEKCPGRKIHIVDSLGATQVQMYIVDRGVADRLKGMTAEETAADLRDVASRLNVMILPRDLFHLCRGGRVNRATAVVGTMLQIKPIIEFSEEGKLTVVAKVKGWTKGLRTLAKYITKRAENPKNDPIYIAHADAYEDACELKAMVQEQLDVSVNIGWIGPIIGTHTGPGTIGVICLGDRRYVD